MKLDRNGYAPSIMPAPKNTEGMVRHEIYYGKNRKVSKENGFWIWLHPDVHHRLHNDPKCSLGKDLKEMCQMIYEKTHTREEFLQLIRRNYL